MIWDAAKSVGERRRAVESCVVSRASSRGAGGGVIRMISNSAPLVSRVIGYVALLASGAAFVTMIDILAR